MKTIKVVIEQETGKKHWLTRKSKLHRLIFDVSEATATVTYENGITGVSIKAKHYSPVQTLSWNTPAHAEPPSLLPIKVDPNLSSKYP